MFDYTVLCGRFQPPHLGHRHVIDAALNQSNKLIILIGSDKRARNARYLPFTTDERIQMISSMLTPDQLSRVIFEPIEDFRYSLNRWLSNVQTTVHSAVNAQGWKAGPTSIALIGHSKDASSFYLKKFPQWDSIEVSNYEGLNATEIRERMFRWRSVSAGDGVTESVATLINRWFGDETLADMWEERQVLEKYWASWAAAPYPPTFVTTDAVVVQSGQLLVIRRKAAPGKNNLALPGGFLNTNETILEGTLRELKEETKIAVPIPVLLGSIVSQRVFDDPTRSARGRTITHASLIQLRESDTLPKIKGSDDAAKAFWMPLSDVFENRDQFFDDHWDIIETMCLL